jgi:hypothetical protein
VQEVLDLAVNQLEGPIPEELGQLGGTLRYLFLFENRLSGSFPTFVQELTKLKVKLGRALGGNHAVVILLMLIRMLRAGPDKVLNLATNAGLTGPIPDLFEPLQELQEVTLWFSNYTGSVPLSLLLGRPSGFTLFLNNNNLTQVRGRSPPGAERASQD